MLFLVHALDKPDALEVRQNNRAAHLDYLQRFTVQLGGPLLDADGQMCGSCLLIDVEDLAAAEAFAAGDPYRAAGLFETVTVREFKQVIGASND